MDQQHLSGDEPDGSAQVLLCSAYMCIKKGSTWHNCQYAGRGINRFSISGDARENVSCAEQMTF